MKKSFFVLLAICVISLAALTACASGCEDQTNTSDTSSTSKPSTSKDEGSKGDTSKNDTSSPVSIPYL